jgi:hypothetical protein
VDTQRTLNRDVRPGDVPTSRSALALPHWAAASASGRDWAWARLRRYAHTFDTTAYAAETGVALDGDACLAAARAAVANEFDASMASSEASVL